MKNSARRFVPRIEAAVFQLDLYAADAARNVLSTDELARAARFAQPLWADRYIIVRALLRAMLGERLDCAAQDVDLAIAAYGKPILGPRHSAQFGFNVSHSGNFGLIALCDTCALGCDLEAIALPREDVAERFFAPAEIAALHASPMSDRAMLFTRLWTRKEAVLKALGLGLASGLDQFAAPIGPAPQAVSIGVDLDTMSRDLALIDAPAAEGFLAAIAVCDVTECELVVLPPPERFSL
jgi:4'-phosphopantetheinyl transferase